MQDLSLLIVDDDADVRLAAKLALSPIAGTIETADSPAAMLALLPGRRFDCLLLDMNFALGEHSGRAGLKALDAVNEADPALASANMKTLILMAEQGKLRPRISHTFRLDQAAEALQAVIDRAVIGKAVLVS